MMSPIERGCDMIGEKLIPIAVALTARHLVSSLNKLPFPQALIFNAVDAVVAGIVSQYFMSLEAKEANREKFLSIVLATRILSVLTGVSATAIVGQVDFKTAVLLNVVSFIACVGTMHVLSGVTKPSEDQAQPASSAGQEECICKLLKLVLYV
jgi:ABC-type glucose/galactose transport system permease subunit